MVNHLTRRVDTCEVLGLGLICLRYLHPIVRERRAWKRCLCNIEGRTEAISGILIDMAELLQLGRLRHGHSLHLKQLLGDQLGDLPPAQHDQILQLLCVDEGRHLKLLCCFVVLVQGTLVVAFKSANPTKAFIAFLIDADSGLSSVQLICLAI